MPYILIILAVIVTAAIGGLFTAQGLADWYPALNLPSWTPPGSVIGAVWSTIYTLLAIAGILAWRGLPPKHRRLFFYIFAANLALNAGWSYLFFSANQIGAALMEMLVLEASIVWLIVLLWRGQRAASVLLFPYVAWVAFASYLTFVIWGMN